MTGPSSQATGEVRRIALIASYAPSLTLFRGVLIRELVARGHRVRCYAPDHSADTTAAIGALGAETDSYPLARSGLNPLQDLKSLRALTARMASFAPHIVMGYTPKPAIYGSLAAARIGVPRIVPMITGLGFAFQDGGGVKRGVAQAVSRRLYARALARSHAVIFHNKDDHRLLAGLGVVPPGLPVHVVSGSGVDLDQFPVMPLPPLLEGKGLCFLMIARLLKAKGVAEFCEAARMVKEKSPYSRFVLVGPEESGPDGFSKDRLAAYDGIVEYAGRQSDVRPFLGQCHAYILPSYGEGMPRTVLEALAVGRPIVTTDARGCRETVDERVNGILVPVADSTALAEAMLSILRRPDLVPAMARASRQKAENRFDVSKVNRQMLSALGLST